MNWFEELTGFKEQNHQQVQSQLKVERNVLTSLVNNKSYVCGVLETPTLAELQERVKTAHYNSRIRFAEKIANVQHLHQDKENAGAMFQSASQFNLLEMVGPNVTPEKGIGIYENDHTQGPSCAIACGAGTIYRNYLANVNGKTGQTTDNQIDCLSEIGYELNNSQLNLWKMSNGYALVNNAQSLQIINAQITSKSKPDYEQLKSKLKIGVQWNTQVTINQATHLVSQAYCSALPINYSSIATELWHPFASLILEATYEATFLAAIENAENTKNFTLYLTLVGGGVFGNKLEWILEAISKIAAKFANTPLRVFIVSYGKSNPEVVAAIKSMNA